MKKYAGKESICSKCSCQISVGAEVWPVPRPSDPTRFLWVHVECAPEKKRPLCPFFVKRGKCLHGDGCFFVHDEATCKEDSRSTRRRGGDLRGGDLRGDDLVSDNATATRPMFGKTGRVGVFRRWLLDEFVTPPSSPGALSAGASTLPGATSITPRALKVLDVAGGKGELSFELCYLNGIDCTVVDPRCLMLNGWETKWKKGQYHANPTLFGKYINHDSLSAEFNYDSASHTSLSLQSGHLQRNTNLQKKIQHLKIYFDKPLLDWVRTIRDKRSLRSRTVGNSESVGTTTESIGTTTESIGTTAKDYFEANDDGFFAKALSRPDEVVLIGESWKKQQYKKERGKLIKVTLSPNNSTTSPSDTSPNNSTTTTSPGDTSPNNSSIPSDSSPKGTTTTEDVHRMSNVVSNVAKKSNAKGDGWKEPNAHRITDGQTTDGQTEVHKITDGDECVSCLLSCDMVLGMHPDGAAEAIIDFALEHNKSFAIVPCCTCSKDFPNRKLWVNNEEKVSCTDPTLKVSCTDPTLRDETLRDDDETLTSVVEDDTSLVDDEEMFCTSVDHNMSLASSTWKSRMVKSYEDLIRYLQAKDPSIRRKTLDFEGKNIVLYRHAFTLS